jgi:hypothetical protein
MPHWLDRVVPRISIEGAPYFARRDAELLAASYPAPAAEPADAEKEPEPVA